MAQFEINVLPRQPKTRMQTIAAEVAKVENLGVNYGEYGFVSTVLPHIEAIIIDSFRDEGLQPPTTKTIETWLYKKNVTSLAIVLVSKCWKEKKKELEEKILI